MCPDASHIVEAVHDDSQYTVGAAAALIHLGFCNRPVALPNLHNIQHILSASNFDLRNTHAHSAAPALGRYGSGSFCDVTLVWCVITYKMHRSAFKRCLSGIGLQRMLRKRCKEMNPLYCNAACRHTHPRHSERTWYTQGSCSSVLPC